MLDYGFMNALETKTVRPLNCYLGLLWNLVTIVSLRLTGAVRLFWLLKMLFLLFSISNC